MIKMPEILYTNNKEEALRAIENGFEPVECSFGTNSSVVGKYKLDHHEQYSSEEPVSIKAAKLASESLKLDRFVVTGTADCEQCYAIAALNGPKIPINLEEAKAIAELDMDPIGRDLTSENYQRILLFNQRRQGLPNCLESTVKSLYELIKIFNGRYSSADIWASIEKENQRRESGRTKIRELEFGKIALVNSDFWGFDVWYESAPIIVSYVDSKKVVTIGLCPKKGGNLGDKSGFDLLGPRGLREVFPKLDELTILGWGGRETIGGSPRGVAMSYDDAFRTYNIIKEIISSKK